jgi:hypothetical protein
MTRSEAWRFMCFNNKDFWKPGKYKFYRKGSPWYSNVSLYSGLFNFGGEDLSDHDIDILSSLEWAYINDRDRIEFTPFSESEYR